MLKFKNKFKFGSSTSTPPLETDESSERNSLDSKITTNLKEMTDNVEKLEKLDLKDDKDKEDSQEEVDSPGVLTVKIYNSQNITLPVKISNKSQILKALAINSNNEQTKTELMKNIADLNNDELIDSSPTYLPSIITIPTQNLIKSLLYLTIEFDNNVLVIEPQKGSVANSTWNQVASFDVTKKQSTLGSKFLNLNLFIRLPNILIPNSEKIAKRHLFSNYNSQDTHRSNGYLNNDDSNNNQSNHSHNSNNSNDINRNSHIRNLNNNTTDTNGNNTTNNNNNSNTNTNNNNNIGDLLIGTIKLPLNIKYHKSPIRLINHEYLNFINSNLGQDLVNMGQIMLTLEFKPLTKNSHLTIDDFDLLKVIGKGSFGKVMQVIKKDTKQIYALKTLRKQHIVSRMEVVHTLAERTVLARVSNPFIVPLKFSFQSPEKLYLVLAFINGGELFWHLQREGKFPMDRSRFYIAELLTALESLHELDVIYRDLKPENILLDYQGHIALCDFGLCKLNMKNNDKTNTFCGTPEYLAPELLLNQGYTRSVDWWTLGTLLYEMLTGLPPFYDDDVPTMYRRILQDPLKFPSSLERTDAKDLLVKLLQKDPKLRLNDALEIKAHPFFKDIDWQKLLNKNYLPPFKPNVENLLDTSNFDQDFTNEKPQDSVVDDFLTESVQKQFGGWTYNGDNVF